jgi:hypothetical protein
MNIELDSKLGKQKKYAMEKIQRRPGGASHFSSGGSCYYS